jgi:hypothetical protein
MIPHSMPSDTISFKSISTGGNSAGDGGNGVNKGNITDNAHLDFSPTNKAYGSDVSVNTGDHVSQKAYWDAGNANAQADKYSSAHGGHVTERRGRRRRQWRRLQLRRRRGCEPA